MRCGCERGGPGDRHAQAAHALPDGARQGLGHLRDSLRHHHARPQQGRGGAEPALRRRRRARPRATGPRACSCSTTPSTATRSRDRRWPSRSSGPASSPTSCPRSASTTSGWPSCRTPGAMTRAEMIRHGVAFNRPLQVVGTGVHAGRLPAASPGLTAIEPANVVVSEVKKAETRRRPRHPALRDRRDEVHGRRRSSTTRSSARWRASAKPTCWSGRSRRARRA